MQWLLILVSSSANITAPQAKLFTGIVAIANRKQTEDQQIFGEIQVALWIRRTSHISRYCLRHSTLGALLGSLLLRHAGQHSVRRLFFTMEVGGDVVLECIILKAVSNILPLSYMSTECPKYQETPLDNADQLNTTENNKHVVEASSSLTLPGKT